MGMAIITALEQFLHARSFMTVGRVRKRVVLTCMIQ